MKYLKVFDKNLIQNGYLINAYEVERRRRINSDYEISFMVPMTSEDYKTKISIKGHIQDERGQFYVINSRGRIRDGKKLTSSIYCTHVMFKLTDFKFPYASYIDEAYGIHISQLTDAISAATGGKFKFSIDDSFDLHDVKDFGRGNCLQALNQIIKMYGCEVEPDNFVIHLKKKIGTNSGMQYRLKKNIVSSSFKDDGSSLVTRMFAQMKDGRTFIGIESSNLTPDELSLLNSVPGAIDNGRLAVNYLISPFAQYWSNTTNTYFDGELIEQDIEDPIELLKATRKALNEQDILTLEATISAADLFKIDQSQPIPKLGDTVLCIDPKMDMKNLSCRITELVEYPFSMEKHSQPTISNSTLQDYDDIISDLERAKNIVDNLFSNGKVRTEVFESFAKQAVIDINNSKTELIYPPEGGILAQEKTNPLEQVRLTSKGIGISTDGWNSIRAAITARGVVAEQVIGQLGNFVSMVIGSGNNVTKINTNGISSGHADYYSAPFRVDMQGNVIANSIKLMGQINNSEMNSSVINAGTIIGSLIKAGILEGGTITGALIRTAVSGRRIETSSQGFGAFDSNGVNRIAIKTSGDDTISALSFFGSGGSFAGEINSYANQGRMNIFSNDLFIGSNSMSNPIYFQGRSTFNGVVTFNSSVNGLSLGIGDINGLRSELESLKDQLSSLRSEFRGHSHSVNIGTHNHGNKENQNWGGTFTTSLP
ncbi:hypothetical protein BVG16_13555 [Paenibacillus selenitireducens]|uniref:Tail spike domain-containing protein n=1 Tax=Paenibacillus selenitireducens TaxID=1324314 RepID=A0A1T2XCR2_9BACL|nr:phage tail protein [Paenibacillus selenitireducens]OPA77476.1 hypothetical protein BVG16_13555 [Paenibacillus selenitireducens]